MRDYTGAFSGGAPHVVLARWLRARDLDRRRRLVTKVQFPPVCTRHYPALAAGLTDLSRVAAVEGGRTATSRGGLECREVSRSDVDRLSRRAVLPRGARVEPSEADGPGLRPGSGQGVRPLRG